jgi:NADH dehydrogenase
LNVLLTGATGFVGEEVLRQLRGAGHSIRILARNPASRRVQEARARHGVEVHPGEIADAASLAGACNGMAAVIHLVGIISEVGRSTFENIHTQGTGNIIAAAQSAGARRFLLMSALGARAAAPSRYHQTKWAAEQSVRASGLDYTIFRPSLIYGPRDHFVNLFATIARFSPIVPVLGRRGARFQPVAVEAVARAFVQALVTPESIGKTYDLCGPDRLTLSEIVESVLEATRRRRFKVRVPAGLAWAQAALLEQVCPKLLGRAPPLNRDQLIMLGEDNLGDPGPANGLFGLPQTPFPEGIAQYLQRSPHSALRA